MNVTSYVGMVTCLNFNYKHEFESSKDTLSCYVKDTNSYIKFTILERCLHYLMITPRIKKHLLGSVKHTMLFIPLINVKMPRIVGILTFMSRKNFMLT